MKRQTIDEEGARLGEVSAASLQLGDDTIAIRRIATMSVERHEFFPWDTLENRKTQSVYATLCVGLLFFGLVGLVGWLVLSGNPSVSGMSLFAGIGLLALGLVLGIRAVMIAMRLKEKHPYFRLIIGTSDGRQIPLVDNNREVLIKIRDVVRYKLDTGDTSVVGDFDLNDDIVNLRLPKGAASSAPTRLAPERVEIASHDVFDEEEDAPPAGH